MSDCDLLLANFYFLLTSPCVLLAGVFRLADPLSRSVAGVTAARKLWSPEVLRKGAVSGERCRDGNVKDGAIAMDFGHYVNT